VGSATRQRDDVFSADIDVLKRPKIVIALLDGSDIDSGTAVERGYAFARKDKKIFWPDRRLRLELNDKNRQDDSQKIRLDEGQLVDSQSVRFNNMVFGVCKRGEGIYGSKQSIAKRVKKVVEELVIDLRNIL
jgi:nucleoside 2-deoxyribosyltransferase